MKFTCTVEINRPKEKVVALWKNQNNLKHWQEGFERYEHLSGEKETVDSKGILHYITRGNAMELEETILEWNLPDVMEGRYVHDKMTNRMRNTFQGLGTEKTLWKAEINYTQFNGFKMKLLGFLGKRIFKQQTQKWLNNFKKFAETT